MNNKEKTLQELLDLGKLEVNKDKWLWVAVSVNGKTPEVIVNPPENVESKLDYYAYAYTDRLTLKSNPEIKIVDFGFEKHIFAFEVL